MIKASTSRILFVGITPCLLALACVGPEEGFDDESFEAWEDEVDQAEPGAAGALEVEAPDASGEQEPVKGQSWCFELPATIYAAAGLWSTTAGNVRVGATAQYGFSASLSPAPQNFTLSVEDINGQLLPRVTENGNVNQLATLSGDNYSLFQIRPPAGTSGSVEYETVLKTISSGGALVCSQTVTVKVVNCEQPATWWDGVDRPATWDGSTCEVETPPMGSAPFIYSNTYYIESEATTSCPYGSWDGTGCYIRPEPVSGHIDDNPDAFVLTPHNGVPPLCPADWDWDGSAQTCSKSIPWGHWGFVENGKWYLSSDRSCQAGNFDGRNCAMGDPPVGSTALLVGGDYHYQN